MTAADSKLSGREDSHCDSTNDCGAAHTINPLALHLISQPGRGRGVFTSDPLPAGTVIEESPVLLLTKEQWEEGRLNDTVLGEYGFCWSNGGMALGLGLASLFNHSSAPNVNFIRNTAQGTISFRTSRAVAPGDELCICYSADESKLWFMPSSSNSSKVTTEGDSEPEVLPGFGNLAIDDESDEDERAAREEQLIKAAQRETRRQLGGATHSSREKRRAKFREKQARAEVAALRREGDSDTTSNLSSGDILSPRPVTATSNLLAATSISSSLSGPSAARLDRRRREIIADLPPPLHSGPGQSRHEHVGPVMLTEDIDWAESSTNEENSQEADWSLLRRVKGPIEIEDDEENDDSATIDVWVVDVSDPKLTRLALSFTKDACAVETRMRHLKRVCRRTDNTGEHCYIALSMVDTTTPATLRESLENYSPLLADLEPMSLSVPRAAARTPDQLRARNALWPVLFSPSIPRLADARGFPAGKLAWVKAGIQRVLADARAARDRGELPVAVFCTSPPEPLWPAVDGFIPPTPGLRAAAVDTRLSEAHPLRHSVLNCIAQIARLRTVPPFSELQPTRNGADYLLTSTSLFVTHEPCVMCAMALLHSRVREVFYVFPRKRAGGFDSSFGVHSRRDLNHRFDAWRWCGDIGGDELLIPDDIEI